MTNETHDTTNGNAGALSRLGGWQVFVIGLVIVIGGGYLLYAGTLPVWAYLLALGVYFVGVGAVVALLGAGRPASGFDRRTLDRGLAPFECDARRRSGRQIRCPLDRAGGTRLSWRRTAPAS